MKRICNVIAFILSFVLLMFSLSCAVYADDYVKWSFSDDANTLSDGEKVYEYYEMDIELDTNRTENTYFYANAAVYEGYGEREYYEVCSTEKGGEIIWIQEESYTDIKIYATEKGKETLDKFVSGESVAYSLWNSYYEGNSIDEETVKQLQKAYKLGSDSINISVRELEEWDCYDLTIHDEELIFSYTVGAVYKNVDGELYYIDYLSLGNQYFDAYGEFSYRSGYVDIAKLSEDVANDVKAIFDGMEVRGTDYTWEEDIEYTYSEDISFKPLFYIALIILGYIFPLPFLVIGLVLPCIKKLGKPRYWYIMSVSSALWLICAVALTVIILLV